jgi:hypothetical protein
MFSALKRLVGIPTLHNGTLTNTDVDLRLVRRLLRQVYHSLFSLLFA